MNHTNTFAFLASLITACGAVGGIGSTAAAQTYDPQYGQPVVVGQQAAADPLPILSSDQLDQLVGPIALYPDPLIAQILPASTYPIDIVKAARLVRSGATPDQIDQQPWDPSVKAVAHEASVLEMMDQSIDWTQQLGQAFIAQPDDVMLSIQRMRVQAQNIGNLVSTPQQQVYVEDSYVRIVPANPDIIYVPTYDPTIVYYTPPTYGSYISFSYGFPCGSWFDLDLDWRNHWAYRPGWTWNHWNDNFFIERNQIRPRHDFEPRRGGPGDRPPTVWHRDDSRPLTFPGRRLSRPSDFDRFRGRDNNGGNHRTPDTIHTPVGIDRGRAPEPRQTPPIYQRPGNNDQRGNQNHGNENRGNDNRGNDNRGNDNRGNNNRRDDGRRATATPAPAPAPAPRAAESGSSRISRPAEPVRANPAPAAPTKPREQPRLQPRPAAPATPAPRPAAPAPPAHVSTPPVRIAPPPAARPATPAYVQPSHQETRGGDGGNRGGGGGGGKGGGNTNRGHK